MEKLFGTDGIRGMPGEHPLTDDIVFKLGKASSYSLLCDHERKGIHRPINIVIGKDTRLSGDKIEVMLSSGITSYEVNVKSVGVISTPGLAYLTKELDADMGIMISASHNRAEENGIKFFSGAGYKLSQLEESRIEKLVLDYKSDFDMSKCNCGTVSFIYDAQDEYIDFLKRSVPGMDLKGQKIILDCAHGAVSDIAPRLFSEMGADVNSIHCEPNGKNINLDCGALHPHHTAKTVKKDKANIGFCFDGDADRLIVTDESGNILDGDYIIAIVGRHLMEKGRLPGNTVVTTVMGNYGLEESIRQAGGKLIRTDVGDRYVVEECLRNNLIFGGEQSGHIVFLEYSTTGDALITALQILSLMKETKKPLSELAKCMKKYPQILLNVPVKEKRYIESLPLSSEIIRQAEERLGDRGRVLVRYSGTESLCRVMVEGEKEGLIKEIAHSIAKAIDKEIGTG
ncbi:MAG: phosphoglucosamine mutase [Candidatus Omnitrophota bacterium]